MQGFKVVGCGPKERVSRATITVINGEKQGLKFLSINKGFIKLLDGRKFVTALYNDTEERLLIKAAATKDKGSRSLTIGRFLSGRFSNKELVAIMLKYGTKFEVKPTDEKYVFEVVLDGIDTARKMGPKTTGKR